MNQKLCKKLRKIARMMTVGKPNVQPMMNRRGMCVHHPESTRGVYRALKRAHA